jgi:hypothetical protein
MPARRRFKQSLSLSDRLKLFSKTLKTEANKLRPGAQRDDLLKRARIADTASHIGEWANSRGLQPPK